MVSYTHYYECRKQNFFKSFVVFATKSFMHVFYGDCIKSGDGKAVMKREAEVKELLISNTIKLIAEGGFEKATTKELTNYGGSLKDFKMNESYIYRIFGSKEKLYEAAFLQLDDELAGALIRGIKAMDKSEDGLKDALYAVFQKVWQFILRNEARCRCYVRYYYSNYLKGSTIEAHRKHFRKVVEVFTPLFRDDADTDNILHCVFTTVLDFGIRVYNGDLEDNEVNREHVFNVLYCMMMTYFKDSVGDHPFRVG